MQKRTLPRDLERRDTAGGREVRNIRIRSRRQATTAPSRATARVFGVRDNYDDVIARAPS
jgi:hypothetical protein